MRAVYESFSFQKRELQVSYFLKLGVFFFLRVVEIFNFSHWEFSTSQETTSRVDLISKAKTYLGPTKWKTTVIIFQHSLEIHENALGGLWSQICQFFASRANHSRKH